MRFLLLFAVFVGGLIFFVQGGGRPSSLDFAAHVTERTRQHILDGDGRGGGHRADRAGGRETVFPQSWSDDRIIAAIEGLANDAAARRRVGQDGRTIVTGDRDGVRLRAVITADGRTIITGYPLE